MSRAPIVVGVTENPAGEAVGYRVRRRLAWITRLPGGFDWLGHYGLLRQLVRVPRDLLP